MKNRLLLIFVLSLFTSSLFAQQLTFRYAKPRIIRVAGFDNLEFDVQVKASVAGTYLWASSIILPFNNTTLTTTASQWNVTKVAPFNGTNLNAGNPMYGLVKTVTGTAPNCVLNIALVGDINASPYGPSSDDFVELTTSYQTMVTVRGRIIDNTGVAGIAFNQTLMNGQQTYISNPDEYTDYTNPNIYDPANFSSLYVGRIYGSNYGWSQVGNSVNAQWVNWTNSVNTSVWDGTATIPGGSESKMATLTIYNGATFQVPPTGQLTVNGNTTNNGTFIIKSDATGTGSFINVGTVTGNATVERYLADHQWWYLGAPISTATATAFTTLSSVSNVGNRLFTWSESGQIWNNITNTSTAMPSLAGFSFKTFDASPLTALFTGALNSGTYGGAANLTRQAAGTYNGFNLVSNPYPSAINFDQTHTGITPTNLEPTIWFRSNNNFPTYNYLTGVAANGGQAVVPAMQAFWVRVSSGSTGGLEVDNSARIHSSQAFYKTTTEENVFRITVNGNSIVDEAVVCFFDNAVAAYDNYDSEKMFSDDADVPQIYTLTTNDSHAIINGFPLLGVGEERIVPMGFKTDIGGTFTFEATNLAEFDAGIPVSLEDLTTGITQDLRLNANYTFTSGVVNTVNRFRLHFGTLITGVNNVENENSSIYSFGNSIFIATPNGNGIVEIYDMLGKKIISDKSKSGVNVFQINSGSGLYLVKLIANGIEKTEKVVISR